MQLAATPTQAPHTEAHRRPSGLDLTAAFLLLATVVLHVVAMAPTYFVGNGTGSLMSQADQAALYAVLAAAWALALGVGLTGPARTPVSAGLAVGIAATELGFRVADLGDVFRYGTSKAGAGLWLMEVAWVVGAAAAAVAVIAARSRHGRIGLGPAVARAQPPSPPPTPEPSVWDIDWSAPAVPGVASPRSSGIQPAAANPYFPEAHLEETARPGRTDSDAPTTSMDSPTGAVAAMPSSSRGGDTGVLSAIPGDSHAAQERAAWTFLVVILSLLVAGAFLPAWDHYYVFSSVTGRSFSRNLGNAFSAPWQVVVGTVLAALALAAVPIVAVRLHNRAVGAALACGSLLVLAAQLVSAIAQVDQRVSPGFAGLSQSQANQLGVQLGLKLTGWFTVDAIAAYLLFASIMVWATLRVVHANSPDGRPRAPDWRSDAISWGP